MRVAAAALGALGSALGGCARALQPHLDRLVGPLLLRATEPKEALSAPAAAALDALPDAYPADVYLTVLVTNLLSVLPLPYRVEGSSWKRMPLLCTTYTTSAHMRHHACTLCAEGLRPLMFLCSVQLGALGNARSTRVQTAALAALDSAADGGRLRGAELSPPLLRCAHLPCSSQTQAQLVIPLHPERQTPQDGQAWYQKACGTNASWEGTPADPCYGKEQTLSMGI